MNLMPTLLEQNTRMGRADELARLNIMTCMECGLLFICLSGKQKACSDNQNR